MTRLMQALLALTLIMAPLVAKGAVLVVWWEKGYYDQENEAVGEIIAAFEQGSGKQVELILIDEEELPAAFAAALAAGRPPDFGFGTLMAPFIAEWAFGNRLVDLSDAIGSFANTFDPDALERTMLVNAETGEKGLYALPMGRTNNHVHVWKSLLAQAGFTLADIPHEWSAFWSFWCTEVQPALRRASGRDDIFGIALPMSVAYDTQFEFFQFVVANHADYVTRDGRLVIDDPAIRQKLVGVMDSYTAIFQKGCTPPGSVDWGNTGNNKAFLDQTAVMTVNDTLSIPNALRHDRPDDYYKNSATIEWPRGPDGETFPIMGNIYPAVVFREGANIATAESFVRFLVAEGWLAHYLDFSGERMLPGDPQAAGPAILARPQRSAPHGLGDAAGIATARAQLRRGLGRLAPRSGGAGVRLGQGGPPRRRGRHQLRAGGRRGHRPHQADPGRVTVMTRLMQVCLAGALLLAAPGARAADLVLWWQNGYYAQEDAAVREIIAAFEQASGKQVELDFYPQDDLPGKIITALNAGHPPDFAFDALLQNYVGLWATEDRVANLSDVIGTFSNLFDPDALAWVSWHDPKSGQAALYGLPFGRELNHVHIWTSLLQQAGLTVAEIPREWEAFWSFWCDRVQPAVRKVLGRDDIWGVALPMADTGDTDLQFLQFVVAYGAGYVSQDGQLVVDDPETRRKLIQAMDSYTAIYRKGCSPPDAVTWTDYGNNEKFLTQGVVMTANVSLSIPNALKHERPEDYYRNTATVEWPLGPRGEPFPIVGNVVSAVVFKGGSHVAAAKDFVRFLVAEGWLAHYLDFTGGRYLPAMSKLLEQPFWLDPSDPHQMASVMQISARSLAREYAYAEISGNWRHQLVNQEQVWAKAVHRVAAEGVSPEQAVDEAIARIKQILSE